MTEPTVGQLRAALERHASSAGEVFPSALGLIFAEEDWSGRLWDVLGLIASDLETMRYLVGGARADEIADCAARWADSGLSLEDMALVIGCGGYDPDPFVILATAGLLPSALHHKDGTDRRVDGERAGTWISDELALVSAEEIVERTRRMIDTTPAAAPHHQEARAARTR